jgi:hypothetical protein
MIHPAVVAEMIRQHQQRARAASATPPAREIERRVRAASHMTSIRPAA